MRTAVSALGAKKSIETIRCAALQAVLKSDCDHIFEEISSSIYPIFTIFIAFWSENSSAQAHRETELKLLPGAEIAWFSKTQIFVYELTKSTALNSELLLKIF